ncbi:MAG: DUF302 domain-containing protein [Gammaproteobacteria bacterium]
MAPLPQISGGPARWVLTATVVLWAAFGAIGAACADDAHADDRRYGASTQSPYEDVVDEVMFAITEHNFRITGGNEIGGAIGKRHDTPFPRSEIVHFCNLEYARKFLEIAPGFLLHMPCKVALYEHEGRVVVETQLLPEDDPRLVELTREVNGILQAIVDAATDE